MKISSIFNVFSKRNKQVDTLLYQIPNTSRNKIILFCQDVFSNKRSEWDGQNYTIEFWNEIHQTLLYRHGQFKLSNNSLSNTEDSVKYLLTCEDSYFLDFIEYIFKVDCLFHISVDENTLVAEINELLSFDNIGYELTEMVKEEVVERVNEYPFFGKEQKVIKTIQFPKIIRKDNLVIQTMAIHPSLHLLSDLKYKTANQEYIEALQDFRKNDYGNCLTKCCSAFESVMKIICTNKRWKYNQNDTAGSLIKIIFDNSRLESYLNQPLMTIATLRNRLSKSHGAGIQPKTVSKSIAEYALNLTASSIVLLINELK
jgi:hypothetical protein